MASSLSPPLSDDDQLHRINPIKALVFTAVFNGVAAVPLIFIIAKIARDEKIMGEHKSGWLSNGFVWATFA